MQLQAILVDDEKISRDILHNYLVKYCPNITILSEAENINQAIALTKKHDIDLVFLDVEMPFGNAFDFLDAFKNPPFEIIMVTAYNQYAKDALNQHVAYYLTKPISIDELIKAVDYVTKIKEKETQLNQTVLKPKLNKISGKITIPTQQGFEIIAMQDILYLKADDNYTEIFLMDNSKKLVSKTLKHFENLLNENGFARIHKSFLVNTNFIVAYNKGKGGSIQLINGKELQVSASKKGNLLSYFK